MTEHLIQCLVVGALLSVTSVSAQTADAVFHSGAQIYVGGQLQEAGDIIDEGLQLHPDDAKLLALKDLIEKEKDRQQQSGEGNSEERQQQQNEQQQPQRNQSGQEEPSEQESGEGEQEEEQDQQGQSERQQQESEDQQQAEDREQQSVQTGQNPDQLSRAQAIRILQALQNEEEQLLREVQKIKGRPRRVEKDW